MALNVSKQHEWTHTLKFQVTFSFYYKRERFPPLQRHWYTALCTWHILGELRCHLLLCHVAAIMGFWETPHGTPPFRGTSLFWRSICCVVAKICWHRVTFIPNFCWLYNKMHNKTLKISFKIALGQMATFNQLLKMNDHQENVLLFDGHFEAIRFWDTSAVSNPKNIYEYLKY